MAGRLPVALMRTKVAAQWETAAAFIQDVSNVQFGGRDYGVAVDEALFPALEDAEPVEVSVQLLAFDEAQALHLLAGVRRPHPGRLV